MRETFFPRRLFWNFFWSLQILTSSVGFIALAVESYVFDFQFFSRTNLIYSFCLFLSSTLLSAFFAYRFSKPLKRVILKALSLTRKKSIEPYIEEEQDLFESEPGEYFELERALDKINKKLTVRKAQLAHEREETQALMAAINDCVVSVNSLGKIVFYNSAFVTTFVGSNKLDLPAMMLSQVIRDPEVTGAFETALKSGQTTRVQVKLITEFDNSSHSFVVHVSALREEKTRDIYGALGSFHDITELKTAEKIRIEFVENASHELRTPLTSLKGYVDTLKGDLNEGKFDQAQQFVTVISKNVDRLSALVNDLLLLSSLEHNSPLKIEMIHPDQISLDVTERLSSLAAEKNIRIKTLAEVQGFKADYLKVEQVLINLISNAIKYIPAGGQVDIMWKENSEDNQVELRVKDNGPGIAEEHQGRLFERFFRVDKGRSRDIGGTGLGLSIVKHIMQSHGGTVAVQSKPGHGAQFVCQFPIRN